MHSMYKAVPVETQVRYARAPLPPSSRGRKGPQDYPTIMLVWQDTKSKHGSKPAMHYRASVDDTKGPWLTMTWNQYYDNVIKAALGFIHLGLEPGKSVNIIGFNSPQWFMANMAAIFAGGVSTGVYTTNTPEQCHFIADDSEAQIVCVENTHQLLKYLAVAHRLPHLRAIVVMDSKISCNVDAELAKHATPAAAVNVLSWDHLMKLSQRVPKHELEARIAAQKPTDLCTLIYTSGTTGNPKGVMLSHYNISFTLASVVDTVGAKAEDRLVTYLPLSHIAEQVVSLYASLYSGAPVWFADSGALRGSLVDTLRHVRPTILVAVPRVWEKIQQRIKSVAEQSTGLKKQIATWAKAQGLEGGYASQEGRPVPWSYGLAHHLVFRKVLDQLGLDKCRLAVTSAAPISKDTLEFFLSIGLPIMEIFGMSECCGPATMSLPCQYRTGKAGVPLAGVELKIADDGELCIRGGNVFMGYFKNPKATKETIDEDGWMHSGDIATLTDRGYLQITDRKKELIITAGGENIAPAMIEGLLRGINVVSQAVVIGDKKPYLVALLTLDVDRLPTEARIAGCASPESFTTVERAANDPKFRAHLWRQIEAINKNKLAQVQTIKKFAILPRDLSVDEGTLTPTMKLKRRVINQIYADVIDRLYAVDGGETPTSSSATPKLISKM